MAVKKHFINRGIRHCQIDEMLRKELANAGYAGAKIEKSPMGTYITIRAARPGIVIGRGGKSIKSLNRKLSDEFNLPGIQIKVKPVDNPELNAQIMAERLTYGLENGENYRRTAYSILRRIMRADARGAEISISGKVTSQRARHQVFRIGVLSKSGFPSTDGVDYGVAHVILKLGVLGVRVKIMPNSYQLPNEILFKDEGKIRKTLKKEEAKLLEEEVDEKVEQTLEEIEKDIPPEETGLFDENADAQEKEIDQDLDEIESLLEKEEEEKTED